LGPNIWLSNLIISVEYMIFWKNRAGIEGINTAKGFFSESIPGYV
jgi:hypothetical protein